MDNNKSLVELFPILEDQYDLASGQLYPVKDRSVRLAIEYLKAIGQTLPDPIALIDVARHIEDYFYDYLDGKDETP
jgi:hypothetical protein